MAAAEQRHQRLARMRLYVITGDHGDEVETARIVEAALDVGALPNVQVGDVVTLIGREGDAMLTADDLAEASGTISYEVLCGISNRVPRRYL